MFPVSSGKYVIRCDIKDGQLAGQTGDYEGYNFKVIEIKSYYPAEAVDNGTGPRVSIIDNDYFYLDGFNSAASLYDMSGSLIESVGDAPEECAIKNVGNNGISEFTLNDKPFCAYVISNTATTPAQAWNIIEWAKVLHLPVQLITGHSRKVVWAIFRTLFVPHCPVSPK